MYLELRKLLVGFWSKIFYHWYVFESFEALYLPFINPNLEALLIGQSPAAWLILTAIVVYHILPGLGKSTLINSLFLTDLYPDRVVPTAAEKIERKTLKLDASTVRLS